MLNASSTANALERPSAERRLRLLNPLAQRTFWVAIHRYCGLFAMALLFVIGLTGSLLAYQHELDAWLNPALMRAGREQPPMSPDALIAKIEQADPRLRVSLFPLDAQPGESVELRVAPRTNPHTGRPWRLDFDRLFVDPTTGAVLGQRQWGALRWDRAHLMPFLNVLHRKFHLPGQWGMWLTGGVALIWLFSSLIGIYLTLPRPSSRGASAVSYWKRWKPAWQIKRGASWKRTNFDLHRAVALWTLPVALMLAVTGVYFNLGNEVFRPIVRLFSPLSPQPLRTLPPLTAPRPPAFATEQAVERARALLPPAAHAFVPWHASHNAQLGVYRIAFKEDGMRERLLRVRYEQLFIDDQTGERKGTSGYESGTAGDRFLIWQYPLHTGRALGAWGRALVCLVGLLTALLCGSGLLIWWVKRKATAVPR